MSYVRETLEALLSRIDPEVYGAEVVKIVRAALLPAIALSALALALSAFAVVRGWGLLYVLAPLLLPALLYLSPTILRITIGAGLEKELPAVLAYLMIYARSSHHVADLLVRLKDEESLPWMRREASRLEMLLSLYPDPVSALKRFAETTPSRGLREALMDYINAQTLGTSRSQLSLMLFSRAMEAVREQWRSHVEFGKIVAEALVAGIVAIVALAPLSVLGASLPPAFILLPVAISPAGAMIMLMTRPSIGEYQLGRLETFTTFLVPGIAVGINVFISPASGLAFLVAMTVAVEIMMIAYSRRMEAALKELRTAAEEARLGRLREERLLAAERLGSSVIKAIISASKVAGSTGIGEMLSQLYALMEEARRQARSASIQAAVLALIAAAAVPLTIYSLGLVKGASAVTGAGEEVIGQMIYLLVVTSPLVALPAAALQRGWLISPAYPMISQAAALLVS